MGQVSASEVWLEPGVDCIVENSQVSAIGATGLSRRMASSGEPAIDQLETV